MNEKLITALLAILLALGGWTLQRTFSLSQDMVLIKAKIEVIENEIQNFKDSKGKKNRKRKKNLQYAYQRKRKIRYMLSNKRRTRKRRTTNV